MLYQTTMIDPDPQILPPDYLDLLAYWESRRDGRIAPHWNNFHLDKISLSVLQVSAVLDVLHDPLDFVYRFWGTSKTLQMGYDLTGKSVRNVKPQESAEKLFAEFEAFLTRKSPTVFVTRMMEQEDKSEYIYFRLPLSSDDRTIDHIFSVGGHARMTEFIWSKILTSALIGALCTFMLIGLGGLLFGIQWGNFFSVLLIVLCLNILIAGFISFLYSFIKTENQAGALLTSVILVMSLLGGSMIPVANFPQIIQNASKLTVNYWGMEAFRMSIMKKPIIGLMSILFGMLAAGIVLSLISSFFIQNNLKKGLLK